MQGAVGRSFQVAVDKENPTASKRAAPTKSRAALKNISNQESEVSTKRALTSATTPASAGPAPRSKKGLKTAPPTIDFDAPIEYAPSDAKKQKKLRYQPPAELDVDIDSILSTRPSISSLTPKAAKREFAIDAEAPIDLPTESLDSLIAPIPEPELLLPQ